MGEFNTALDWFLRIPCVAFQDLSNEARLGLENSFGIIADLAMSLGSIKKNGSNRPVRMHASTNVSGTIKVH